VLAALCCVLLTVAMGSGRLPGDSMSRVTVNLLTIASLAATALVARHASTRPETRRFCTVMTLYLFSCLGVCFLLNVVNLIALPTPNILASDLLIALPELMLCEWTFFKFHTLRSATASTVLDSTMLDSLQPSIMALGGVCLALYGLRSHPLICGGAVVSVIFCYAMRTQLFFLRLLQRENQLRKQAKIMERLATQDALTGIGNRRWFDETAQELLREPDSQPCSVLLIDTDRFKQINDTFGHEMGDQVLHAIAAHLQKVTSNVRRSCCARIGGDEFAALLPGVGAVEAAAVAENLKDQIESSELRAQVRITVSVGIATTQHTISLARLMRSADAVLYQVKANQRNSVRCIEVE
jgi:diguanylate cyclase (GGDEF)-like protein